MSLMIRTSYIPLALLLFCSLSSGKTVIATVHRFMGRCNARQLFTVTHAAKLLSPCN